jgi:hypothetical protein
MEIFSYLVVAALVLLPILLFRGVVLPGVVPQQGMTKVASFTVTGLAVSEIRLFSNNITVGPNTVIGDLTESTFTGYAAQALATVPAAVADPVLGGVSIFIPSHLFTASGTTTPAESCYGAYLVDTAGALIAAANLQTPVDMSDNGDSVMIQMTLNFLPSQVQMQVSNP